MNLFIASGNLGRDAEVKYLPSGTAICEFSLPVKSGYGDRQTTTWFKCFFFGKRAEGKLPGFLTKGVKVTVCGEFSVNEWEKDGVRNYQCKINCNDVELHGGQASQASQDQQPASQPVDEDFIEDDISF